MKVMVKCKEIDLFVNCKCFCDLCEMQMAYLRLKGILVCHNLKVSSNIRVFLNVFAEFIEFNHKAKYFVQKGRPTRTYYLLLETQVADRIFRFTTFHASVIYKIL